jgi:hypothetical protein
MRQCQVGLLLVALAACAGETAPGPGPGPGDGVPAGSVPVPAAALATAQVDDGAGGLRPLAVPEGAAVYFRPRERFTVTVGERDKAARVCASLTEDWSSLPETFTWFICTFPVGGCNPVPVVVMASVECENSCGNPTTFVCTAFAPGCGAEFVARPAVSPDITCQTPCNSQSRCNSCF